ncbi:hypothetical protein SAMN06265222_104229 [Neorhodopirellula lusitana]|uniref:Uncharacterized protein n=1 Tax=Neorhodopirellula lusitana TaxID=445327 RepID=A0ABY1Q085_9BACT|nr:hypothetical protein SAMN06265222_104229 [Neorhodopirellula lusitana]
MSVRDDRGFDSPQFNLVRLVRQHGRFLAAFLQTQTTLVALCWVSLGWVALSSGISFSQAEEPRQGKAKGLQAAEQDPPVKEAVAHVSDTGFWTSPMREVDTATADQTLLVIVITDDIDPAWISLDKTIRLANRPVCWCETSITKAVAAIPPGFAHPSAPIEGQHWPLGIPKVLTGGESNLPPGRTITVVTDGHYRTLGVIVGIPEDQELVRLIEEAEETRGWLRQHRREPDQLVKKLAERSRQRLPRIWQLQLDQQVAALGTTPLEQVADAISQNERFTKQVQIRFGQVADQVQHTYKQHIEQRFGMTPETDFRRLVALEQHSATRMPWMTTLLPFMAGADLRNVYLDLAETVWDQRAMPIQMQGKDPLGDWLTQFGDQGPFALHIPPPYLRNRTELQLAKVSDIAQRRGFGWQDLDEALGNGPVRETNLRELATWLYRSKKRPLDLQRPSQTRYLFFRSSTDSPYPIRDGEPPGRSITMIRQVQK